MSPLRIFEDMVAVGAGIVVCGLAVIVVILAGIFALGSLTMAARKDSK